MTATSEGPVMTGASLTAEWKPPVSFPQSWNHQSQHCRSHLSGRISWRHHQSQVVLGQAIEAELMAVVDPNKPMVLFQSHRHW